MTTLLMADKSYAVSKGTQGIWRTESVKSNILKSQMLNIWWTLCFRTCLHLIQFAQRIRLCASTCTKCVATRVDTSRAYWLMYSEVPYVLRCYSQIIYVQCSENEMRYLECTAADAFCIITLHWGHRADSQRYSTKARDLLKHCYSVWSLCEHAVHSSSTKCTRHHAVRISRFNG